MPGMISAFCSDAVTCLSGSIVCVVRSTRSKFIDAATCTRALPFPTTCETISSAFIRK